MIFTEEEKATLDYQAILDREKNERSLWNRKVALKKRIDSGKKINKITSSELRKVLVHWFDNGRGVLRKSMLHVYTTTDHVNKETDWVDAILSARHLGKELTSAFSGISNIHDVALLNSSKIFDKKRLYARDTLSRRIKKMDTEIKHEELIIENERLVEEVSRLKKELISTKPWQEVALLLIKEGQTQLSVAKVVGKSISTIKRLIKNNEDK